ncbi:inorganic phosphate transporter [Leptolyngbya sp. NIES-2104]|uniref:inorganic phosphate transporter n=1 Tax=Leptolyngbya sp. NIES-2104 TaxID=1552121 RepID=UPI0006EC6DF5|nr:inorganic phosphate transporter [Leptolyngbya sp. NIES-2104]GAP99150.1 probable low-affinity inorganic phosphate transporter [Leptolyngbya sp. NIES-2104]
MILILSSLLAFYLAWNLGANDVANSMGTSVGSKAVTLKQALIIAGILEFTGAVLFGRNVSETLITGILDPAQFTPQMLIIGMISVLVAAGIWLNVATLFGFPVSSSHATVGAIAGVGSLAFGLDAVNWNAIELISITWIVTPFVSGLIAAMFYSTIKRFILDQPNAIARLQQWIPWISAVLIGIFGVIVFPTIAESIQSAIHLSIQNISLILGVVAISTLSISAFQNLQTVESTIAKFQVVSACFVAFAHGSNDVGNAIAPFAAIVSVLRSGTVQDFEIPIWILVLGGTGIVAGLAVLGGKVISTIGEGIISLQPSGGLCAELATATTILIASRYGLPVSTSHALVGGVVGVGLVQGLKSVRMETIRAIVLTWLVTIPISAIFSGIVFLILRSIFIQ